MTDHLAAAREHVDRRDPLHAIAHAAIDAAQSLRAIAGRKEGARGSTSPTPEADDHPFMPQTDLPIESDADLIARLRRKRPDGWLGLRARHEEQT